MGFRFEFSPSGKKTSVLPARFNICSFALNVIKSCSPQSAVDSGACPTSLLLSAFFSMFIDTSRCPMITDCRTLRTNSSWSPLFDHSLASTLALRTSSARIGSSSGLADNWLVLPSICVSVMDDLPGVDPVGKQMMESAS